MSKIDRIEDRVVGVTVGSLQAVRAAGRLAVDVVVLPVVLISAALVAVPFAAIRFAEDAWDAVKGAAEEHVEAFAEAFASFRG